MSKFDCSIFFIGYLQIAESKLKELSVAVRLRRPDKRFETIRNYGVELQVTLQTKFFQNHKIKQIGLIYNYIKKYTKKKILHISKFDLKKKKLFKLGYFFRIICRIYFVFVPD